MRRHDLLRAPPAVWDAMLARYPGFADIPLVADWSRRAWPVIVRRPLPGDPARTIPAALPLPPIYGKRRIAFHFLASEVLSPVAAVPLRDAAASAPPEWHGLIQKILSNAERLQLAPCVFGGLLWQYVTGLDYLSATSDLDLLWNIEGDASLEKLLGALSALDVEGPFRLDGELIFPDGAAVNWRELAQSSRGATVLMKTLHGVEIRTAETFFAMAAVP